MLKKTGIYISVIIVFMLISSNGCDDQEIRKAQSPFPGKAQIGCRGILYERAEPRKEQDEPCEQALIRKKLAERLDRPGDEFPEGDLWFVRIPTTLVHLRPDDELPKWKQNDEGEWIEDTDGNA